MNSDDPIKRDMAAEYKAMVGNLTATQARCTELLEENRRYKKALEDILQVGHEAQCRQIALDALKL